MRRKCCCSLTTACDRGSNAGGSICASGGAGTFVLGVGLDHSVSDPAESVAGCVSRVRGPGSRVQGSGFRVQGTGSGVQGSGFRAQGSGLRG